MEWQHWGRRLTEVLELERLPVAVSYTDSPPSQAKAGGCRACEALLRAADGEVIDLTADSSTCPGGSLYLGLRPFDPAQARGLREFLIRGEKLFSSPAAIHRSVALTKAKPPLGAADHVVFAALSGAPLRPDVAVLFVDAWQAARLVNLTHFENGLPMECDPTGSLCRSVIAYPVVTGKVNVSFGDITARKMNRHPPGELFVTLPYSDLASVVASLDQCSAGTAKPELPPEIERTMEEAG